MAKSGVVLNVEKNKAIILTPSGEFAKVKIKDNIPKIGETFSGEKSVEFHFFKYPVAAACILFFLLIGTGTYAYYTPSASVIININPSIKLSINRWDKIISTSALNSDGERVLGEIQLKNKNLNDGLTLIVDEAKKDNFINEDYINAGKTISVYITSSGHKDIDVSKFQSYVVDSDINIKINADGKEIPVPAKTDKGKPANTPGNSNNSAGKNNNNNDKNNNSSGKQNGKDDNKSSGNEEKPKDSKPANPGQGSKDVTTPKNNNNNEGSSNNGNSNGNSNGNNDSKDTGKSKGEKPKGGGKG